MCNASVEFQIKNETLAAFACVPPKYTEERLSMTLGLGLGVKIFVLAVNSKRQFSIFG